MANYWDWYDTIPAQPQQHLSHDHVPIYKTGLSTHTGPDTIPGMDTIYYTDVTDTEPYSSGISMVWYDNATHTMVVKFKDGGLYKLSGVHESSYKSLVSKSGSVTGYYNRNLRNWDGGGGKLDANVVRFSKRAGETVAAPVGEETYVVTYIIEKRMEIHADDIYDALEQFKADFDPGDKPQVTNVEKL